MHTYQGYATAAANPYPSYMSPTGSGTLAIRDPLSTPDDWSVDANCIIENNALHVSTSQKNSLHGCGSNDQFSDFAIEVQMTVVQGDCGGIVFRKSGDAYYFFSVCQDGTYTLRENSDNSSVGSTDLVTSTSSTAIQTQTGVTNTLGVVANGSTLILYVNQLSLGTFNDDTYSSGNINLAASAETNATEVAFSNLRIWK